MTNLKSEALRAHVGARRVLLVEDDSQIATTIMTFLKDHSFEVDHATDGDIGLAKAKTNTHDIMIVDRMMPGIDGLTVIASMRSAGIETPVLVLSAMNAVDDRINGLKAGGDDYMVKPYALGELAARLEALLRRPALSRATTLNAGPIYIDLIERTVRRAGRLITLLPREFRLLEYMVRSPGRVLTRAMLLEDVWQYRSMPNTNLIDVHISNLRRKVDGPGEVPLIVNVRGVGFMLKVEQ